MINIIISDYINYPNYSHFFNVENIYNLLIKQNKDEESQKSETININSLIRLTYHFNGYHTPLNCYFKEKIKDIYRSFLSKINPERKQVISLYNNYELNEEMTIEEIITETDKKKKKLDIYLYEICDAEKIKINIKDINCPYCKENIFINFDNYKINLQNCKNGHIKNNIIINDLIKTQNTDSYGPMCGVCYHSAYLHKPFYKCFKCDKNICESCKENHDKSHSIIDYKYEKYLCNIHNGIFHKYCSKCNKNICIDCQKEHSNHNFINLNDIVPDKETTIKEEEELRKAIDSFKNNINIIILKLNNVINTFELYYKISNEIINSFYEMGFKNYELIKNLNEFRNQNKKFKENIINIINEKNIFEKFKILMNTEELMRINNNYISGTIFVNENNINRDIRIINSYEQMKRESGLKKYKYDIRYENEREIKEICNITIDDKPIEFTYFYKFNKAGEHRINYSFSKNLTKANDLFYNCEYITGLNFSNFNSEFINNMCSMFYGCKSLSNLNLSNINTQNSTNMSYMFYGCESLISLDLSQFKTNKVIDMSCFLSGCKKLINLNLSKFDINKVIDLSWMFYDCKSLKYIDLSKFNTENALFMET